MRTTWRTLLGLLAVLALLAAGCGADEGESASEEAPASAEAAAAEEGGAASGSIDVDGSSTVGPLTDAIAEEYANEAADVTVNVGVSGTGGGFERFCGTGDTQISNASRPIEDEEAALCEENGIEYTEVRVGTDALTMVTNPATDFVDCLTTEEVQAIWGPEPATSWDQVNPEFPAEPIAVFAPGADSGTYDFFNETVLEEDVEPRQDYNASEDDNIIAQGVIGTPGSWGYFGFAYFQESGEQLKALAYDAGEGCVEPSVETAQDDSYGLTRPLFIYVRNDALADPQSPVGGFVTYYLETVNSLIEDVGYIPAPDEQIEEARASVEAAIEGGGGASGS
jgi:phosphate transport system substrate-binding protein